jgi:hypothetical protein
MSLPLPSESHPGLHAAYLAQIADWLMEEWYATADDLHRRSDDGYTRGCTRFGRQKNRIKDEALSGKYPWLTLINGGNDLVFGVTSIPCRFANDDAGAPTKDAVTALNRYQMPFFEFMDDSEPSRFCFVVDRGQDEAQDPRVEFLGFNAKDELACRWIADTVRVLSVTSPDLPQAVQVAKPIVLPKQRDAGDAAVGT